MSTKLTRGKFLKAVGAGAAWIALTTALLLGCEPTERTRKTTSSPSASTSPPPKAKYVRTFRSRPDLRPPTINVATRQTHHHHDDNTAPGYIFVAPKNGPGEASPSQDGPMIVDDSGEPVWFRPSQNKDKRAMDFKVQYYRGKPVLTWWEGVRKGGYGLGEYVIADGSYWEIRRVRAGNGYEGDHHEFLITPQQTALITVYGLVGGMDLSSVGGPKDGMVLDGIAQELDIDSGEVLFEWHSLDHVGIEESYVVEPPKDPRWPFDYFHINSIDVDHDSNLLISARRTSAVYKVERTSGEIIWRLGGKKSSFQMAPGTQTRYQHDARRQPDGTLTIFDNGGLKKDDRSYGLMLEPDIERMAATLVRKYAHPEGRVAATQGNLQVLPNENVFIGWGSDPLFSEFTREGQLLFNASFPPEVESYRAFRFPWRGKPGDNPAVTVEAGSGDEVKLYVSWNGATEVASWQVVAGSSPQRLKPVIGSSAPKEGFETAVVVRTSEPYVGVEAKDRSGGVLGTSRAIKLRD